jgi:hypothetical protein
MEHAALAIRIPLTTPGGGPRAYYQTRAEAGRSDVGTGSFS